MALHFPILVNEHTIGYVNIRRLHELTEDRVSSYEYEAEIFSPLRTREAHTGFVTHNYDDSAFVLIQKVLEDITTVKVDVPPLTDLDAGVTVELDGEEPE